MRYNFLGFIVILGLLFSACDSEKKKSMTNGEEVTVEEFIEFYPELKLPVNYNDTSFPKKDNDSLLIDKNVFYKFNFDSAIAKIIDVKNQPKFYAVGKFRNGEDETYLITKSVSKEKKVLLLSAYNKEKNYIAMLPLIRSDKSATTSISVTIDSKFNISKNITRKLPGDVVVQGHDVYILNNSSKNFMLVMTDSLGEASGELINPIDTLPQKQKYTGDYGSAENFISFRDGQGEGRLHMFIHISNKKNECDGELKGEIVFTAPTVAEYRQAGDPCILRFTFSNSTVKIEEVEGCGSRLGSLQCSFNGNYTKRKIVKTKTGSLKKK